MTSGDEDHTPRFRTKVTFMKTWKPANPPSNRDRLELYALHKQAISGDAPTTVPSSVANSAPEKAKYQAWKSKQGMPMQQAMQQYMHEAERQIRMYGTTPSIPTGGSNSQQQQQQMVQSGDATNKSSNPQTPLNTPNGNSNSDGGSGGNDEANSGNGANSSGGGASSNGPATATATSRGLAAIPLLCAAACESRPGYIRRLGQTPSVDHGWWKRQEVLCAAPNSIMAIPESILLFIARLVEFISLAGQEEVLKRQRRQQQQRNQLAQRQNQTAVAASSASSSSAGSNATPADSKIKGPSLPIQILMLVPSPIIQAYLWPIHNCLLSLWMAIILVITLLSGAWRSLQTLIWGARRTGMALRTVWQSEIQGSTQAIHSLCQPYQAISCRLVGLVLLPISTIVGILHGILGGNDFYITLASMIFTLIMMATWWYWMICLPWLATCLLGTAFASGACFALIEFAGV
eukprot:CAMPEP_0119552508 /NCGR_PEP_ID=MMETSP1352-20130426/5475_1 /TAXON_ID=265584 /ORGANISM="Stauroneis constricta, Strain CCMP1120" /LENGTH=461 /DNA_ID=CAMNT_0007598749 /DNA_START=1089 /DNA_END=2474 /DNA_ORIENTATION=-